MQFFSHRKFSYIEGYIERVGGYEKLKLYTRKEVEKIEDQGAKDLFDELYWYKIGIDP
jgi:hypothetical protein